MIPLGEKLRRGSFARFRLLEHAGSLACNNKIATLGRSWHSQKINCGIGGARPTNQFLVHCRVKGVGGDLWKEEGP